MQNNKTLWVALVVVAVIAIIGAFRTQVQTIVGATPGPTHTEGQEFFGGSVFGKVNATSSSVATYTLTGSDIALGGFFYDTIAFSKTGAVATTTWTLPASSTVKALPKAGQRADVCFYVATSSASNPGLTLAAGTGWTLQTASTTATDLTISGGSAMCGTVIREAADSNSFDFLFLLNEFQSAE